MVDQTQTKGAGWRFSEDDARAACLVKAFEECDSDGLLLPLSSRDAATRAARQAAGDPPDTTRFLIGRAQRLTAVLREKFSTVLTVESLTKGSSVLSTGVLLVAFLIGLGLDAFGPSKSVNILAFPVLLIVAWNLGVYVLLALEKLRRKPDEPRPAGWRAAAFSWIAHPSRPWVKLGGLEHEKLLSRGLAHFLGEWWRVGATLHRARAERLFHLGAIAMVAGVICGMYLRGLVLDYAARWESTFLEQDQVRLLVKAVLGPAESILGTNVPVPNEGDSIPAAIWIHLYAVTASLFVVVPRAFLALFSAVRAARLERNFPIDTERSGYYTRLLAKDRGSGSAVAVWPYSYEPSSRTNDGLRTLLLDVFGNRARIELKSGLEYGAEWEEAGGLRLVAGDVAPCVVLVFNLAQSPEQEVHGHLLDGCKAELANFGAGGRLLVLVDETKYRRRLGSDAAAEERFEQRRRAWERLVRESGVGCAFASLEEHAETSVLENVRRAVWSDSGALIA